MSDALPLFDHHVHLDDPTAAERDVVAGLALANLRGAISAGYGPERDQRAAQRIGLSANLYRTVGLHPWWLAQHPPDAWPAAWLQVTAQLARPRVVALGEIGLDRSIRKQIALPAQLAEFHRGLSIARTHQLPTVLHVVGWHGHALSALTAHPPVGGVVHRFGGAAELVVPYLDLGLHLSVHPARMQRDQAGLADVIAKVGADHLLVETDWPSAGLSWADALADMAQLIVFSADILGKSPAALATAIVCNAQRLYGLTR
ncbi:MAG: TatD family hydrolase [Myxococcales bacterium]|nr:TatD family hydrolase [Myxococcales bacterium]